MFIVESSHTSGTDFLVFSTSQAAWQAVAEDYATSDHGADRGKQETDAYGLSGKYYPGTYLTHDGIRFTVREQRASDL